MDGLVLILIIIAVIYLMSSSSKAKESNQKRLREQNIKNAHLEGVVKCPKCLSTQVSANKKGITLTTGLIGSQNVYITCLQCGHRWKAGS
jgi:DNA-directed RNA polymerase subunit M/transcription elongation factor TFIIS